MPKITLIGAGSTVFARNLMGDILSFPELAGCTLALHDIDEERLREYHAETYAQERFRVRHIAVAHEDAGEDPAKRAATLAKIETIRGRMSGWPGSSPTSSRHNVPVAASTSTMP